MGNSCGLFNGNLGRRNSPRILSELAKVKLGSRHLLQQMLAPALHGLKPHSRSVLVDGLAFLHGKRMRRDVERMIGVSPFERSEDLILIIIVSSRPPDDLLPCHVPSLSGLTLELNKTAAR